MATSDFFADTYAAAREKFLAAAGAARCDISSYPLPNHTGPYGEELTIDVGKLGPAEPHALLVLISGTHGVEGFCGSGCQVGFLTDRLYEALPVALEYGTKPVWEVLTALRADHWLHSIPNRPTELRGDIKRNLRDAFYVDRSDWKAAVYGRAADFTFRTARGLGDVTKSSR